MAIIMGTKYLMARPRYRFVLELNDYKFFINWWENGHALKNSIDVSEASDAFTSFPSGHSAYSLFAIFIFPVLMKKNTDSSKYEIVLFLLGIIWWILTAYSRITVGAHYLTDICFGGMVTIISYLITIIIFRKYKKA